MGKRSVYFFVSIFLFIFSFVCIYAKNDNLNGKINIADKYSGQKLDKIKSSIKQKKFYRFLIESNDSLSYIEEYFDSQDKNIQIKQSTNNTFLIKIPLNSKFLKDELSQINNGLLPEKIGNYKVVEPELVESFSSDYLTGELLDNLWGIQKIGAQNFQEELSTKDKIKVGVLDTGIDYNNLELNDNYNSSLSYNFVNEDTDAHDNNGHGTQVAGIIGAEVNNSGIFGVNSNSDLVSLKVLDENGLGTSYDILEAIDYAKTNQIKVLNMSFGGIGNPIDNPVCDAISDAKNNGIFVITSAGNNNTDILNSIPAGCSDSITVGAIDQNNNKTSFSNYGTGVLIYAPGENIYTTSLNNTYQNVNGTSFSSAFVAGLVSKELAFSGSISREDLISNITKKYGLLNIVTDPSEILFDDPYFEINNYYGTGELLEEITDEIIDGEFFQIESSLYPSITSNGIYNCNRIEIATFSNGYSLKHYTLSQNLTQNIGRTELYKNGVLLEYQDNVFYQDNGYPNISGNSCYLFSRFKSVTLGDNGIIDLNYYFWDGFKRNYGVKPTKFYINKKNVSDINVTTSVFGYAKHFYIKLNLKDNNISDTINIASQGFLNDTWKDYSATSGSWLWGARRFGQNGCIINNVIELEDKYTINYSCILTMSRSAGSANGNGYTNYSTLSGNFYLSKLDYNLCSYSQIFCSSGYTGRLPWETYWEYTSRINSEIVSNPITSTSTKGDPINLNTGEFTYDNILMQHNSKGFPFEFEINYKNKTNYEGIIGYNFDHSYNQYLTEETDGNIYYHNGKLGVFEFVNNGAGFDYNTTLKASLELVDGKYNIVFNNSKTYVFNTDLKIERVTDNFNNTFSFTYNTDGNLETITDSNNRVYTLNYNLDGKLESITDFNSDKVEFTYYQTGETQGLEFDLKTIKILNNTSEKEINFTYSILGDEELAHNIIKLIDSENNIYVENTYDESDRVSSQKYGNASINYTYTTDSDGKIIENSVIDREGNNTIFTYDSNGNTISKLVKKISGDSLYSYEYDSDNYISKEIHPLGNGYTYKYDLNHNLIEKRQKSNINAIDSDDDIVTSYIYDLEFNKPTRIVSPNGAIVKYPFFWTH